MWSIGAAWVICGKLVRGGKICRSWRIRVRVVITLALPYLADESGPRWLAKRRVMRKAQLCKIWMPWPLTRCSENSSCSMRVQWAYYQRSQYANCSIAKWVSDRQFRLSHWSTLPSFYRYSLPALVYQEWMEGSAQFDGQEVPEKFCVGREQCHNWILTNGFRRM